MSDKSHLDELDLAVVGFILERIQTNLSNVAVDFATMVAASLSDSQPEMEEVERLGKQTIEKLAFIVADSILIAMANSMDDSTLLDLVHAQRQHYYDILDQPDMKHADRNELLISFLARMLSLAPEMLPHVTTIIKQGYHGKQAKPSRADGEAGWATSDLDDEFDLLFPRPLND